ncbi:hypothetical protein SAMN05421663_104168 [Terribacillus halophilus]|uniref:Uncharacterized protein n=1 Tax=Terribacillus halophilus TaxID=361279 RepID=A0A1G6PKN1_9BACI|nr:hypothetical protein [Terribacillus halophilus]SDC80780.1 hypothetical protein SAMN05421663_104168 [Terribacillus halophilus]
MTIYDALKTINWQKAEYFKFKFPDLRFDQSKPLKSEDDFMKTVNRKSMNAFTKWEKTSEYKYLIQLYLDTKIADDYEEIYKIVAEKAKGGEEKSIRLFLTLQKDIQQNSKMAAKSLEQSEDDNETEEEDSDLDLS